MIKKNQKAMLANFIGGFIVILIGVSLIGPIAQEINNVSNCILTNESSIILTTSTDQPKGSTDSFGGGGAAHFGGYDNQVKHNAFVDALASTSMVKTNQSFLNPDCTPITGSVADVLKLVPMFFAIAVGGIGLTITYSALNSAGLLGSSYIPYQLKRRKERSQNEYNR